MELDATVVIAVRDGEAVIGRQLASLARGSGADRHQVVIADDGSTDRTLDVVRDHTGAFGRVDVVTTGAGRGPAHARNVGAAAATTDNLVFVDSDDEVGADFVAAVVATLRIVPFVTAALDLSRLNPCRADHAPTEPTAAYGHLPFAPACAQAFRTSFFHRLGGYDETLSGCEDVDISWRAAYLGHGVEVAPGAVLHYRERATALAAFRQGVWHGRDVPRLFKLHRAHGMRRRSARTAARSWLGWVWSLRGALDPCLRRDCAYGLGLRLGRLRGSVRHRVLFW